MISLSIIGNLGKDAEVKEVNGKKVINFSVCHTQKNKDGVEKSTWVECGKWGETTAIAPYLLKGTKVYVEGIPDINVYKKNDGEPGGSIRVLVNKIELLGGGGQQSAPTATGSVVDGQQAPDLSGQDLPF